MDRFEQVERSKITRPIVVSILTWNRIFAESDFNDQSDIGHKMVFSKGRVDFWNGNPFRFDNGIWKLLLTLNLKSYIAYEYKFEIFKLLAKTVERFSIPADNCRLYLDALISMFDSKSYLTFGENKELKARGQFSLVSGFCHPAIFLGLLSSMIQFWSEKYWE